jgi:hypothetical protein
MACAGRASADSPGLNPVPVTVGAGGTGRLTPEG